MSLLIGRGVGQAIVINNKTTVTVNKVSPARTGDYLEVQLKIDGPKDIPVNRKEVQDKLNAEAEKEVV